MGKCSEDLVKLIKSWMEEKSHRIDNVRLLSDRSGVPYNTLRRIYLGGTPECQNALQILDVVASKGQSVVFLREHFSGAARFLEPLYENKNTETVPMTSLVQDPLTYLITNLAYGSFVRKGDISERYGSKGLEAAEALCEQGKASWDNEGYLSIASGATMGIYRDKADVVTACSHITDWSKEPGGYPMALVGNVTESEFEELKALTGVYCDAVAKKLTNSKGGAILVAVSSVFTSPFRKG